MKSVTPFKIKKDEIQQTIMKNVMTNADGSKQCFIDMDGTQGYTINGRCQVQSVKVTSSQRFVMMNDREMLTRVLDPKDMGPWVEEEEKMTPENRTFNLGTEGLQCFLCNLEVQYAIDIHLAIFHFDKEIWEKASPIKVRDCSYKCATYDQILKENDYASYAGMTHEVFIDVCRDENLDVVGDIDEAIATTPC